MTCYALAEHRLYGFGATRATRTLKYVDDLMGDILEDRTTLEQLKKELKEEVGILIEC